MLISCAVSHIAYGFVTPPFSFTFTGSLGRPHWQDNIQQNQWIENRF